MPIIRGSHSGGGGLRAVQPEGQDSFDDLMPQMSIEFVNDSYDYLTIRSNCIPNGALLPNRHPSRVICLLKKLGEAMVTGNVAAESNSTIPPIYTYWGQFIDHDITAGTDGSEPEEPGMLSVNVLGDDFVPLEPAEVTGDNGIKNLRYPQLDLDSIYGGGPTHQLTIDEGIYRQSDSRYFKLGSLQGSGDGISPIPGPAANSYDFFRRDKQAISADSRNDENLILSQFHVALLHFHNRVVDACGNEASFTSIRNTVTWHFQWLVVNDYLRTICKDGIVDEYLFGASHFFDHKQGLFMPLEFAAAAFRFGHSMVRPAYDYNANFGRGCRPEQPMAGLADLFEHTGLNGNLGGDSQLPFKWQIDWTRFTDLCSQDPERFARKIDTNLAFPLADIPTGSGNPGDAPPQAMSSSLQKHLAQRNLLRGYLLSIPVGQHVADWLGVQQLTQDELLPEHNQAIKRILRAENNLLLTHTPLWYYVLREAAVQANGNALGEVGSRLVAGTLIGLLRADKTSYLYARCNDEPWSPATGLTVNGKPIVRILDLLRYAKLV